MKSIRPQAGSASGFESRLQVALVLTRRFNGHLSLILPRPAQDYVAFDMFGGAHFITEAFDAAEKERRKMQARIDERMKVECLPWDWQIVDGTTADALINAARLGDIMIMSLDATTTGAPGHGRALVSDVVTASRTPVLAVPIGCKSLSFDRAMVAYDGGFEAANALRGPVDPAYFKPYIFPLIFFKRISDTNPWEAKRALPAWRGGEFRAWMKNRGKKN